MPIAIIINAADLKTAILSEDSAQGLVKAISALDIAPELSDEAEAREWLQTRPAPSGWFETVNEARAHLERIHKAPPILSGADVRAARETLGMTREEFATALGMGGNANTRHKSIYQIEIEDINKSSGRPRVLNPQATERLRALMAEHNLKLAAE